MLRATVRVMLANYRARKLQSALLFLIITLGAGTLMLAFAVRRQAERPFEQLLDRANGAHVWVQTGAADALATFEADPRVKATTGAIPRGQASISSNGAGEGIGIWGMTADLPVISRPLLEDGRWLSAPDEIVLEAGFAKEAGLAPGDTIEVRNDDRDVGPRQFTVVGLALITSRAPFPMWGPGQTFVLEADLLELTGGAPVFYETGIQLVDESMADDFALELHQSLPRDGRPEFPPITWQRINTDVANESEITTILFSVFSVFALIAATLIVGNTVSSTVLAHAREIGILKAIGFSPRSVMALVTAEQVLLATIAAVVGVAGASLLAPFFVADIAKTLNAPRTPIVQPVAATLVVLAVAGLVAVTSVLPAWNAGRVPAVRVISGWQLRTRAASRLESLGAKLGLPPVIRIGLKDTFARPVRSWLMVVAMALAMATIAMTLSIEATLARARTDPQMFGNEAFDLTVFAPPGKNVEITEQDIAALDGVRATATGLGFLATAEGTPRPVFLRAISGDIGQFFPRPTSGRHPETPGEVMVAEGLAEALGLHPGSQITFDVEAEPGAARVVALPLTVTGIYRDSDDDGMLAITPLASIGEDLLASRPTFLGLRLEDPGTADAIEEQLRRLAPESDIENEVRQNLEDMNEATRTTRPILFGLNMVLIVVAGVNVLTVLIFAVREQYREIGILKAIGFTPGQVAAAIASGVMLLALAATLVGIPIGLVVTEQLFDYFGKDEGWRPGVAVTPAAWQLALMLPAGLLVAMVGAVIPARAAARLRVSEAMRYT